jgi:hypothetical protein
MAYEEALESITVLADGDMTSNQFKFVKATATGFALQDVAGGFCLGVLQDKPAAAGRPGNIAKSGVTNLTAGAAIAKGAKVQSTAAGLAVTAAVSGYIMGEALEAASASGDVISVKLESPTAVRQGSESVMLGAPIAADDDRVVTAVDWGDGSLTIAAQPDVPRNVTAVLVDANTSITAGVLTITGEDTAGRTIVETMTLPTLTLTGTKLFAKIDSVVISGTAGSVDAGTDQLKVGVGNVIGTPSDLAASSEVLHVYLGGARQASPTVTTGVSLSGIDASAGTYDGSKLLLAIIKPQSNL